jgi:hypothetical protein
MVGGLSLSEAKRKYGVLQMSARKSADNKQYLQKYGIFRPVSGKAPVHWAQILLSRTILKVKMTDGREKLTIFAVTVTRLIESVLL